MNETTGRRLTLALLVYYLAVVGIITLAPFRFIVPRRPDVLWGGNPLDFFANIALFLPLGFLHRLSIPRDRDRLALAVLLLALLVSGVVESVQLLEPERYSSPLDVVANGLGAWVGAALCDAVSRRIRASSLLVGRLSLEIPLLGLVYLLLPLLWLGSLSVGDDPLRIWLLALPGLFGARVLAAVHIHHFGRTRTISARSMALAAAGGMLLGVFPLLATHPFATLVLTGCVAFALWLEADSCGGPAARTERRFEVPALRGALPLYAAYMLALAALSIHLTGTPLAGAAPVVTVEPGRVEILRFLESVAAFTVLGYALAELRGRLELGFRDDAPVLLLWTGPMAALVSAAIWLPAEPLRAVLWLALTLAAALHGAGIYHLQRAHVRRLLGVAEVMPVPAPERVVVEL